VKWQRGDAYYLHSGRYFISKARTPDGWRYVLSVDKQILGVFDSAEEAKGFAANYGQGRVK
jgi:hypothetical protein